MKTLMFLPILIFFASARADDGTSLQAYKLAKEAKWAEARDEARRATRAQPSDAEGWFLLGLSEARLENLDEAASAYEKYLSLSPEPGAAQIAEKNRAAVLGRARKKNEAKFGRASSGFFVEKSLSYKPSFLSEVHGDLTAPFGAGFHFGMFFFGYKRATGSFKESIRVPDEKTKPVSYAAVPGGGTVLHQELFLNIDVSLVDPYDRWGNLQLALPVFMGGFINTLDVHGTKYGNIGYDLGTGLQLRGFTRSWFSWYVQGIYHLGIPFWGIRKAGQDSSIRNVRGEDVKGSISGFETTVGISFLFGSETTGHY